MAAAIMFCVRCSLSTNVNIVKILEPHGKRVSFIRFLKSDAALIEEASVIDQTEQLADEDFDLERRRNKSRLQPQHRNILNDNIPYSESHAWYHNTVKYKKRMYGRYGEQSGVNPGVMWPTRQELAETKEFEAVAFSQSIQEMIKTNNERKKDAAAAMKAREEEILKKVGKLEQWKSEINTKIAKKLADAQDAKDRKDRLVEEVRRHFGYKVDARDDRFKEMLAQKEKEEKKSMKEAKKKAKDLKMVQKLSIKAQSEEKNIQPQE